MGIEMVAWAGLKEDGSSNMEEAATDNGPQGYQAFGRPTALLAEVMAGP